MITDVKHWPVSVCACQPPAHQYTGIFNAQITFPVKSPIHRFIPSFPFHSFTALCLKQLATQFTGYCQRGESWLSSQVACACCAFHEQCWREWRRWLLFFLLQWEWLILSGNTQWDTLQYSICLHITETVAFKLNVIRNTTEQQRLKQLWAQFCFRDTSFSFFEA